MARNYVDSVTFVKTFLSVHKEGGDIQEVADRLGMQKASATVKASQLRQSGVNLPKLSQSRKKLDRSLLAKMVSDYEANMSLNLEGKEDITISNHLDKEIQMDQDGVVDVDIPNDDDGVMDEDIPGRGLVNAAF